MRDKPIVLTGIRANNDLHVGNYFGALLPIIDMATKRSAEYQINLFVPDLHSFTTPIDHRQLHAQILHNLKLFVAAGLPLDNPDIHIYRQSYVSAHSELTWILDCFTGFGEMGRMTQFKDKSAKLQNDDEEGAPHNRISVGLFNYPVLMAADMLLYGALYVPVGEDQTQHLEFTRDIGERMNKQFAYAFPEGLFTIPLPVSKQHAFFGKEQGLRIRDLQNPSNKMSKSDESGKGIIFLGDNPENAARKIMSAETDSLGHIPRSLDYTKQPGVSNLLQMLALLEGCDVADTLAEWADKTSYGQLKESVAEKVRLFLLDFQTRLAKVDQQTLIDKLETSETLMREAANRTLYKVQRAVGLRPQGQQQSKSGSTKPVAKPAMITFEDFAKLDIKIGKIINAMPVDNSDRLIALTVDLGAERRTIVTGMREFYEPESFIGKQLPIISNLQPQTFRGMTSQGMLMAIEGSNGPVLLLPEQEVSPGSQVS